MKLKFDCRPFSTKCLIIATISGTEWLSVMCWKSMQQTVQTKSHLFYLWSECDFLKVIKKTKFEYPYFFRRIFGVQKFGGGEFGCRLRPGALVVACVVNDSIIAQHRNNDNNNRCAELQRLTFVSASSLSVVACNNSLLGDRLMLMYCHCVVFRCDSTVLLAHDCSSVIMRRPSCSSAELHFMQTRGLLLSAEVSKLCYWIYARSWCICLLPFTACCMN